MKLLLKLIQDHQEVSSKENDDSGTQQFHPKEEESEAVSLAEKNRNNSENTKSPLKETKTCFTVV